jgi:predicted transposase YbfD/YdcC
MDAQPTTLIPRMFNEVEVHDPRADNARHFLTDILVIAILGVMCGCNDYPGILEYAMDEQDWLKEFLPLPHGIPSISTFRRVFAVLRPSVLQDLMRRWSGELAGTLKGKQITLDGKVLRRSFRKGWEKDPLHIVSAWCVEENLVLGQVAVPKVLEMLDIKGATITVDALNTQKTIAQQIIKGGGDYLMAVKDNHPDLHDSIRRHLDEMILEKFAGVEHVYHESVDGGHGRIDTRRVWATQQIDWLVSREQWSNLTSVAVVESVRHISGKDKPKPTRRYYISSLKPQSGQQMAKLIRNHWSIENSQHWSLDMAFNEDQSRVRKDHGDQNLAVLRRIALGLLRRDKSVKVGAQNKRLKAGRNREYLLRVLLSPVLAK